MQKYIVAGLILTAVMLGSGCANDADSEDTENRETLIQEMEEQINALRLQLEQLREDVADGDAGAEIDKQADMLQERIRDAESELDGLRGAGDDEWEALKGKVHEAISSAGELAEDIRRRIGMD